MHHFSLSIYDFNLKTKLQILYDFVVSVFFGANACTNQYEFILVHEKTTTSAFHKVV